MIIKGKNRFHTHSSCCILQLTTKHRGNKVHAKKLLTEVISSTPQKIFVYYLLHRQDLEKKIRPENSAFLSNSPFLHPLELGIQMRTGSQEENAMAGGS